MALVNLGTVRPGSTLVIPFSTYDSNDPSKSITTTELDVGAISVYKDGGTTKRASTTGEGIDIDVDSIVGTHWITIDLSSNATAGFYAAGSRYVVILDGLVIDAATAMSAAVATFDIGYPNAIINTTVASVTSQTQFILTVGPAEADVLIGCKLLFHDVASAVQLAYAYVTDYAVTTKEITCTDPVGFTFVATDNVSVFLPDNVHAVQGTTQTAGDIPALLATAQTDLDTITGTSGVLIGTDAANVTEISDAVWDEAQSGHTTAGSFGEMATETAAILADTGTDGVVLAADAITAAKIADNAIAVEHIANGAITAAKITALDSTAWGNAQNFFDTTGWVGGTAKLTTDVSKWIGTAVTLGSGAPDVNIQSTDNIALSAQQKLDVNTEADNAIVTYKLDHLVFVADGDDPVDGSIMAHLVSATEDWSTFVPSTDSLQAIRDHVGDGTNLTEAGATGNHLSAIPWNAAWDAEVQSEVDDALIAKGLDHLVFTSVTGADIADDSIIAQLVDDAATADWDNYDNTTASLEALNVDTDVVIVGTVTNAQGADVATDVAAMIDSNNRVDVGSWLGTAVTISSTTAKPEVDVSSVSDDATAANNLELQYDTTGLTGDTFPATQSALGNIGSSSGGSLSFAAEIDNAITDTIDNAAAVNKGSGLVGIPITGHAFTADFQVTIASTTNYNGSFTVISQTTNEIVITATFVSETFGGSETCVATIKTIAKIGTLTTNTFVSIEAADSVFQVLTNASDNLDWAFQYDVGGGRTASKIVFVGYLTSNNDSMNIQAYDFVGSDWETRAILSGTSQTTSQTLDISLLSKHTGISGTDIGKVLIRFVDATAAGHVLGIDLMLVEAVGIGQTVGYQLGAVWIDTDDGVAGTEDFVNGVADNPVLTVADALTIAASVKLHRFICTPDSSITFTNTRTNEVWVGEGTDMALGGRDVGGTHFMGMDVTGIGSGAEVHFDHCELGNMTVASAHFDDCDIEGTVICDAAANYQFVNCAHSGTGATIDFGTGGGISTTVHMHDYHGALTIKNMGQSGTDVLHWSSADGKLTLDSTCIGGTVNMNGTFDFVNNGSGMTLNQGGDAITLLDAIKVPTDKMVFTKANELDANTKSINDAEVVGDGNATPWDGA